MMENTKSKSFSLSKAPIALSFLSSTGKGIVAFMVTEAQHRLPV